MEKKKVILCIGILLLFFCIFLPMNESGKLNKIQKEDMTQFFLQTEEQKPIFGVLEIPSIGLKNPLYYIESEENTVDKNIQILKETISEGQKNQILVLAAHSGSGIHSYFKSLDKLKEQAKIILYYQDKKMEYEYFKKEEVKKTGTVYLENYNFSYIALITCSKNNNETQEIYYAKSTNLIP